MIATGLGLFVKNINDNTLLERNFLKSNAALFIETAHALPGTVVATFRNKNLNNYSLDLKDSQLILSAEGLAERAPVGINSYLEYHSDFIPNSHEFTILKSAEHVYLGEIDEKIKQREFKKIYCPEVKRSFTNIALLTDPESEELYKWTRNNINVIPGLTAGKILTTEVDAPQHMKQAVLATAKERKLPSIILHQTSLPYAIAYLNVDSTTLQADYYLACKTLNGMIDAFPEIPGISILPLNTKFSLPSEHQFILKDTDHTIFFALPQAVLPKPEAAASAIHNALKKK